MPSKHDTALASVRGLLGIVAGLGITNTLQQLIKMTHEPIIHLTSFTTEISRDLGRDLGQGRLLPFLLAVFQIIIALRFYQSSTILIEDRHQTFAFADPNNPTKAEREEHRNRQRHFAVHVILSVIEGIIVAASSFYIHYPSDFVILLSILFITDALMTRLRQRMELNPSQEVQNQARWWFWWNLGLGVFLSAWYWFFNHPEVEFFVGVVFLILSKSPQRTTGVSPWVNARN